MSKEIDNKIVPVKIQDEFEHIILEEEYDEIHQITKQELINEKWFLDLIDRRTKNKLKRKYSDIEFGDDHIRINAKRERTRGKVIVLTGTIGAGKTTLSFFIAEYFRNKGLKVFIPEEISLKIKEDLNLFITNTKKYAFYFQDLIIDTYETMMKIIDAEIEYYDIIILDRTYVDTEVFTNVNSDDDLKSFYLKMKCEMIDSFDFDHVIYVKCSEDTAIKRQKERNRKGEKYTDEYMLKVYREYERIIDKIYPTHILFDMEEDVYVKDKDGYVKDDDGKKQINKQVLDTYYQIFDKIFRLVK
jgi:thymidylate kinase